METPSHYVLTGGPCSGKTTTINELKERGYSVLPEAARTVIAAQLANGKTIQDILSDPLLLEHSIIAHQLQLMAEAPNDKIIFLDRGMPDNIAYYRKSDLPIDEVLKSGLRSSRYRKIFLLEMIEYIGDAERYETLEEAQWLHREIRKAYIELDYTVIDVPVTPVAERADFILANL